MNGIPNWRAPTAEECEKIEVGDRVRSYDFEFRDDCYIEGIVEEIREQHGCMRFSIRADKQVSGGKERKITRPQLFYPPANGVQHAMGGYCNCVRKVTNG